MWNANSQEGLLLLNKKSRKYKDFVRIFSTFGKILNAIQIQIKHILKAKPPY